MKKAVIPTCPCRMSNKEKLRQLRVLLEKYGNKLPESAIREATQPGMVKKWSLVCDCEGNIVSAGRREKTDWYLWTIKNLVTKKEARRQGFGSRVTQDAIDKSVEEGAHELAADIDFDNVDSIRVFEKRGFKPVSEFCWKKGEKPAYVLHHVFYPPSKGHKCK